MSISVLHRAGVRDGGTGNSSRCSSRHGRKPALANLCYWTIILLAATAGLGGSAYGQTFGTTGTTTMSVAIGAEASLAVNTSTTTLTTSGSIFAAFTGTTSLTYKIRTTQSTGTGTVTAKVTTDFSPASGPSVAAPPSAGDTLTYTCTVSSPGTACSGTQTASTTAQTSIATFGAGASSAVGGNSASLSWILVNDPLYHTGSYTATVTFTVSAT